VLEGEQVFQSATRSSRPPPAGSCSPRVPARPAARGAAHRAHTGPHSPAGLEGFFRELAEADRAGTIGPDTYTSASKKYGITWLS
jgi:hypothetical protein